jgi:predicted Zn-dependent protease
MQKMGRASFEEIKQKQDVLDDPEVNRYVDCVAGAITGVVAPDEPWEVVVFDEKSANAFALPGGKIGVHSGLLDVARNQDQLATVLAHEVAHVRAEHGNARMSAATVTQVGVTALQIMLGGESRERQQMMALLGVGATVGILLPYSRSQETEADLLGLDYMARAGFDPRASVQLWKNMSAQGGGQPPQFLSTHPSHGSRIDDLEDRMPKAMKLYQEARAQGRSPQCE